MSKPTILLIDDERYFLLMTKEYIEDAGYSVIVTDDVEEGVRNFYEKKPDAVVMDIVMPKEFGTEVCRDLKETEQGQNTPIILMSSGVKEMAEEGSLVEYKADGYILKPFDKEVLLGILKKYLDKETSIRKRKAVSPSEATEKESALNPFATVAESGKEADPATVSPKSIRSPENVVQEVGPVKLVQGEGELIVSMKVDSRTKQIFTGNSMINIRGGGLFIATDTPAALGTKVRLNLDCAGEVMDLKGMVVWVQPANISTGQHSGMGIRFQEQKSESIVKLKTFIGSLPG